MQPQIPPYQPYFGTYPLNPSLHRGYKPTFPDVRNCASPGTQFSALNPSLDLGYWGFLAPALLGTVGSLFLSLCSEPNPDIERSEGNLLKLVLIGYAIGATVAASFAVKDVVIQSKAPHDHLLFPIGGALGSIILLFTGEYLLLFRFFPSSFKGDMGDDFCSQLISFFYFSITTIATANLGDILPANLTARILIATEIAFNLFTLATGIQLLLAQH